MFPLMKFGIYKKDTQFSVSSLKEHFSARTLTYFFLILFLTPHYSYTDKISKRAKNIKNMYQEDPLDYPVLTQPSLGCSSCRMKDEVKQRNIEVLKGEILKRMGFQQAPNITGKVLPQIPAHYLAMVDPDFGMQSDQPMSTAGMAINDDDDEEYRVKTEKILTFAQPYPRLRHKVRDILHFTFSDSVSKYHVDNATLFVYIRSADKRTPVLIEIFKVIITDHSEHPVFHKVAAKQVYPQLSKGEWVPVDFTETVSEWFKSSRSNYGFVVNATVNGKKVAVNDLNVDKGNKAPYVEISTTENKRRLRRSTAINCDALGDVPVCCRYPLKVDFEEIGFDFIIAPKYYHAYMCSGDCSYLTEQRYLHTHLAQIAQPNGTPPCCTPRKLSGINMLYYDAKFNILFASLPGMVVDRCGCS